jgi:hypothetical protein
MAAWLNGLCEVERNAPRANCGFYVGSDINLPCLHPVLKMGEAPVLVIYVRSDIKPDVRARRIPLDIGLKT